MRLVTNKTHVFHLSYRIRRHNESITETVEMDLSFIASCYAERILPIRKVMVYFRGMYRGRILLPFNKQLLALKQGRMECRALQIYREQSDSVSLFRSLDVFFARFLF